MGGRVDPVTALMASDVGSASSSAPLFSKPPLAVSAPGGSGSGTQSSEGSREGKEGGERSRELPLLRLCVLVLRRDPPATMPFECEPSEGGPSGYCCESQLGNEANIERKCRI